MIGILHRMRTEAQWRDLPDRFGPWKTVYERHRLWFADGTWERLLQQVRGPTRQARSTGTSRSTPPIVRMHTATGRVVSTCGTGASGTRSRGRPTAARLRKGSHGGWPPGFGEERHKKRNTVARAINKLKHARAVATRYDKRGYVFLGIATAAALVIWLRT